MTSIDNSNENGKEKYPYHRRFVRYSVRLKVELHTDKSYQKSYQTMTQNLSESGVCFEIPKKLEKDHEVELLIFLTRKREIDPSQEPVRVTCRVVWQDFSKKGYRHGGEFLVFKGDGEKRLKQFVSLKSLVQWQHASLSPVQSVTLLFYKKIGIRTFTPWFAICLSCTNNTHN